ncbi:Thiolase, N-terminal domain-containing protein [Fimicolochytrium jonesii]|uniref:Thiolase, N-terminal domain-containing protein n=1 Tax=Fimicolochytrium jonesii TaxID=1396493 RepID=UPI0022FE6CF0|nr:Thiolase, N-terminal domain-containing protein [Fimicolochytrium jonesii]KAI8816712.1 Thiolase, N-terminal domain-containing protein [Fimicolochytrium jonesii]
MSAASDRIQNIAGHLTVTGAGKAPKSPDDVVIVAAQRTPLCKGGKGAFKETHPEYLLSVALKSVIEKTGVDPSIVQDIQVGNVLMPGAGVTTSRMAALHAGYPESVALSAVNRQCSSGLATCGNIAGAIKAGYIDVGVGAGVESMTMYYGPGAMPTDLDEEILAYGPSADVLIPMGITSENVAKEFKITREAQDKFALRSHTLASKAQKEGLFDEEIVPVKLHDGTVVTKDDGIRATNAENLAKLRPAFGKEGTTTAGNASQITDGAAAVLLMRRSVAEKLGLKVLARWVGYSVVGVPPRIMGIGPEKAIPEVLRQTGLKIEDIDIFEINEAFASQAVYCAEKLKIPAEKINPKGGAIAFGHPMGATGARQIATLLPELRRQHKKFGIVSMCVGIGMGVAAVIENEVL